MKKKDPTKEHFSNEILPSIFKASRPERITVWNKT